MKNFFDVHKDALTQILSYCEAQELCNFAQLSKRAKELSDDETLWRDLLIQDFHFTEESAERFKRKMGGTYKLVYRYCKEDELNYVREKALLILREYGLTENHLRGRYWFLEWAQVDALVSLIKKCHFAPYVSLLEIEGLSRYQLEGLVNGLTKFEVVGLSQSRIRALCEFKHRGLTAEHLRTRSCVSRCGDNWFYALKYLIDKCCFAPFDAISELDGLTEEQCCSVRNGIPISDVVGLSCAQTSMLVCLRKDGKFLDINKLREQNWPECHPSYHPYVCALKALVYDQHMICSAALDKIANLTLDEAVGIYYGLSDGDVRGLTTLQMRVLSRFQSRGLMAKDLRGCDWFDGVDHFRALDYLIERNLGVKDAMAEIAGLTESEARGISNGFSRADVIGLSYYQIEALCDFSAKGLTADHLRDSPCFCSHDHVCALRALLERGKNVDDAMGEIKGLNESEACGISFGFCRDEVLGLSWVQLKALNSYGHNGLTVEYMRTCDWFYSYTHSAALSVLTCGMNVVKAMSVIEGLNSDAAHGIACGLSREEVKILSKYQIQALLELKDNGLTAEHLCGCDWFVEHWHQLALSHLIKNCNMTPDSAMDEIRGLNGDEVVWIWQGFSRDEFDKLSCEQIEELINLRRRLSPSELYNEVTPGACAIRALIAEFRMNVKYNAMKPTMSAYSVWDVVSTDVANEIASYASEIALLMSATSRKNRSLFTNPRELILQRTYLRRLLRFENAVVLPELYPYFKSDASVSGINANPAVQTQLKNIEALFAVYKGYFQEYMNHRKSMQQKRGSCIVMKMPNKNFDNLAPWSRNEKLCDYYDAIKAAERLLHTKLIEGTALGVLQAGVEYIQTYHKIRRERGGTGSWDLLNKCAVNGIGCVQLAAGKNICDLYFCGSDMKQHLLCDNKEWTNLDAELGRYYFLLTPDPHTGSALKGTWGTGFCLDEIVGAMVAENGCSLIEVIAERLGLAKESNPKPSVSCGI